MVEDREALLERYRAMREALLAAIAGLAHLALWDDIRADEVERISAGYDSAWRMASEQDEVFNGMAYEMRRALSLDQVRWELARSFERLVEAIAAATPRGPDPSLYGEAGLVSSHASQHAGWIQRWRGERGI